MVNQERWEVFNLYRQVLMLQQQLRQQWRIRLHWQQSDHRKASSLNLAHQVEISPQLQIKHYQLLILLAKAFMGNLLMLQEERNRLKESQLPLLALTLLRLIPKSYSETYKEPKRLFVKKTKRLISSRVKSITLDANHKKSWEMTINNKKIMNLRSSSWEKSREI